MTQYIVMYLRISTFTLAFILGLLSQSILAADLAKPYAVIRYVRGLVTVSVPGGVPQKAKRNQKLYEGETVFTSKDAFAILKLQDGSTMKMDPKTELKVEALIQRTEKGYLGSSYFILGVGGAMIDVVKKFSGPPSIELETKKGVAIGVRGTIYYAFIDPVTTNAWAVVREGEVEAMDYKSDDMEKVQKGYSIAFIGGEKLSKPFNYTWVEGLRWNKNPKKGKLGTNWEETRAERLKELEANYKEIMNRTPQNFLEEKKKEEKEYKGKIQIPTAITSVNSGYQESKGKKPKGMSNIPNESGFPDMGFKIDDPITLEVIGGEDEDELYDVLDGGTEGGDPTPTPTPPPEPTPDYDKQANDAAKAACNDAQVMGYSCYVFATECSATKITMGIYPVTNSSKVYYACAWVVGTDFLDDGE